MRKTDFRRNGISRASSAGSQRITTLNNKIRDYPMKCKAIIKMTRSELYKISHGKRGLFREKLTKDLALACINSCPIGLAFLKRQSLSRFCKFHIVILSICAHAKNKAHAKSCASPCHYTVHKTHLFQKMEKAVCLAILMRITQRTR
jgi:hypothetical protein